MYESFERLKHESESLVSLSATQPQHWSFFYVQCDQLNPPSCLGLLLKNVWLWLLNNEGSLQGAGRGDRYNLNVVKSAKQKGGYQRRGWMWPLQKGMASQIAARQMAAGTVCSATPLSVQVNRFPAAGRARASWPSAVKMFVSSG